MNIVYFTQLLSHLEHRISLYKIAREQTPSGPWGDWYLAREQEAREIRDIIRAQLDIERDE